MIGKSRALRLACVVFAIVLGLGLGLVLGLGLASCDSSGDTNGGAPLLATVNFVNQSSFNIRIYRNFNPEMDPAAYVGTAVAGAPRLEVRLPPSGAGEVGCTFFLRYQVALPGSVIAGVNNQGVMVGAAPNWDNVPIVIRANGTYTVQLRQPSAADLAFGQGYIAVQNTTNTRVWLERGASPLHRMDNGALWLNPGEIGFYEIAFAPGQESLPANMFHLRDEQAGSSAISPFVLAQGNLYRFVFSQTGSPLAVDQTLDILAAFR